MQPTRAAETGDLAKSEKKDKKQAIALDTVDIIHPKCRMVVGICGS